MKKYLILTISLLPLFFNSCNSNNNGVGILSPESGNFISAKFNGVTRKFIPVPDGNGGGGIIEFTNGAYILVTVGVENIISENTRNIQIVLASKAKIKEKEYFEDFSDEETADQLIINYQDLNEVDYFSPDDIHPNPLKLTITKLNARTVEGTFTGSLYLDGDSNEKLMKITEGKFSFKY